MLYNPPQYRILGDRALLVEMGDTIHREISDKVRRLFLAVLKEPPSGLVDAVPAYCSLLLTFNPHETTFVKVRESIDGMLEDLDHLDLPAPRTHQIPVVYGGDHGPDLPWVSRYHDISSEAVVRLHTESTYHVYMIGFIPGFPYMGELPKNLETPRKKTPRTAVPRGSVGLAQQQTGIYPAQSPGGWQIIGRTPLTLFNPLKNPPTLLQMGDRVQFYPITEAEIKTWPK